MFREARIKLTAWYLMIIVFISVAFSIGIYRVMTFELDRMEERQRSRIMEGLPDQFHPPFIVGDDTIIIPPIPPQLDLEIIAETKKRFQTTLVIINLMIFGFSAAAGYFLAGRTLKPIKNMMDEQNRFIGDASHELKTPLTSLKSAFEVYLRNPKPTIGKSKTLVAESIDEVNKLQSLSESLLQLAQYQKPNNNLKFEQVSLVAIINEAIKKIKPIAEQKNITIQSILEDQKIKGNKYSLVDLIVIILDNAVKYSESGSKVCVEMKKNKDAISVVIKDQGIGISKNDLPHIFSRFYRANKARTQNASGGYGLGLAIARQIVKAHKGSIAVESKLNKGSVFTITFSKNKLKSNTKSAYSANFQLM